MLKVHERIGYVEIPAIDQEIPMYVGTSEEILQKGAGLLEELRYRLVVKIPTQLSLLIEDYRRQNCLVNWIR